MIDTYIDIFKHLDKLGLFHIKPGHDRMNLALKSLNLENLPYIAVQIVGTNGKGSTSTFLSSLAIEHGLKVGLYTSPHFLSPSERILFQNKEISHDVWLDCAKKVYAANPELSYFEFLTVLASLMYAHLDVDIVFFEAGLGGVFDATTALKSPITVFTPIDIDHSHILGSTLSAIANDKAHALHSSSKLAVTAPQQKPALLEIENVASHYKIPLYQSKLFPSFDLTLKGIHQQENASLALTAWHLICEKLLGRKSETQNEKQAFKKAFIPGRLQIIEPIHSPLPMKRIILDGAHNPHAMRNLQKSLKDLVIPIDILIFTCLEDKDLSSILPIIAEIVHKDTRIYIPELPQNPRSSHSSDLKSKISSYHPQTSVFKNLDECLNFLQNKEEQNILICGSLYLLAEFYTLFPRFLSYQDYKTI